MSDIFISYAREDKPGVEPLAKALEDQGWSVWWDRKIPPGKTFAQVIEEAISTAKCVIVIWSNESVKSDWVQNEAAEGARRKILVPALFDNVQIPFEFRRIQAADLIDWKAETDHPGFTILLGAISEIVGPSPLKVKASDEKRAEEERIHRHEVKAEIKTDKSEPVKVKPPEPDSDTMATTETRTSEHVSLKPRALKLGIGAAGTVLLIVGIWLWFSQPNGPKADEAFSKGKDQFDEQSPQLVSTSAQPVDSDDEGETSLIGKTAPLLPGGDRYETAPEITPGLYKCTDENGCWSYYKLFLRAGQQLRVKLRSPPSGNLAGAVVYDTNGAWLKHAGDKPGTMRGNAGPASTIYEFDWTASSKGWYYLKVNSDPGTVFRLNRSRAPDGVPDKKGKTDLVGDTAPLPLGGDSYETAPKITPGLYMCTDEKGCWSYYKLSLKTGQQLRVQLRSPPSGNLAGIVAYDTNGAWLKHAGDKPGTMRGNAGPASTIHELAFTASSKGWHYLKANSDPGTVFRIQIQ